MTQKKSTSLTYRWEFVCFFCCLSNFVSCSANIYLSTVGGALSCPHSPPVLPALGGECVRSQQVQPLLCPHLSHGQPMCICADGFSISLDRNTQLTVSTAITYTLLSITWIGTDICECHFHNLIYVSFVSIDWIGIDIWTSEL